ncbi:DUF885 domain-containing protein [Pelomonas sp. SE-A7]|uniref:DUF885 domain-containing protein n=1 Tax=Pelomonas sp. SE-A7 TaxID=3054953 RepID=UPI00259C7794|nr:DUF885 domain-containing protein [Pelomonas sp. SE-A7]MDM4768422.1 DUF885 domain-containing protein [Pelomonas sp. SE-A7]
MKKPLLRLAVLAALLSLNAARAGAPDFDSWAEGLAVERMRADPTLATVRQYLPEAEQQQLDGRLTPNTPAQRAARIASAKAALQQLAAFDRKGLNEQQRSSAAMVEWSLRSTVDGEPYEDFDFVFNQFRGLHVSLVNFLSQTHPIRHERDIANYLARLSQAAGQIDNGITRARAAAERGFLMPRFITEAALGQFERLLADEPARNVLVVSLAQRMDKLSGLKPEAKAKALDQAEKQVADSVIPALRRAQALLKEQLPKTTMDAGLWRLSGGDKAYAYELRRNTSTDYTPEQIHRIGRAEVARIEAEMDGLLKKLGFDKGTVMERMKQLDDSLQPREPNPQPALIARYAELLRDAEQRAKSLFEILPKAPVEVRREPPFTEKTAAAHYSAPAKDGSLPGIFWAPLPGPTYRMTNMRTLTYHEGVPGHHFQIALQQEATNLPRYRRDGVFSGGSAFTEGWALYSEQLAAESGWYGDDIPGRLGQLDAELFRAKRLVADTGLHAMKWTRQQALDYGIPGHEVDRYVVMPGQACSYKLGMLHILELRQQARARLGDKFSLPRFHTLLLQTGNVPLTVLSQVVGEWVASQQR